MWPRLEGLGGLWQGHQGWQVRGGGTEERTAGAGDPRVQRVCGRGGSAGGAGQGELKATGRGGECTKEVKVTVLGAVQGFSSSAWEMVTKSSQQNVTHVLGRIFAFWLTSFLRKMDKLLARCVCSPHISPQHSLKEHPEGTFSFYRAGRLFWVYQEPVCIIEVTLHDLVCLCDINNTCFPKVTNPGPTGNLGVSEEMQD